MMEPKNYKVFLGLILFVSLWLIMPGVHAAETVRVGYFDYKEASGRNIYGTYTEYSREYFKEIARYTDWQYEFIPGSLEECFERIQSGEIDLLCGIQYLPGRGQLFEYSRYQLGSEIVVMHVLPENDSVFYEEFAKFNGLKVGIIRNAYQEKLFDTYMVKNNFFMQKVYFNSYSELKDALHKKNIDVMLSSSLFGETDEKVVAEFSASPYYFIAQKGNTLLMDKLNSALEKIRIHNPYFNMKLYEKYYSNLSLRLKWRREDIEIIEKSKPLRIVCEDKTIPLEFFDKVNNVCAGAYVEAIKNILDRSNIRHEFISSSTTEDGMGKIRNGKADIILSCYANELDSERYLLDFTEPYIRESNVFVSRKGFTLDNTAILKIAVLRENMEFVAFLREKYPQWQVQLYDNLEECISAIEKKEVDLSMQNMEVILDFFARNSYENIVTITAIETELPISLGVSKQVPKEIRDILNQAVLAANKKEIEAIVVQYRLNKLEDLSISAFIRKRRFEFMWLIMAAVIISSYCIIRMKRVKEKELAQVAYTDQLTGIRNFEKFKLDANKLIRKFNPTNYAVVYMDIEKFKYINEIFGYDRGNTLLIYFTKLFMHQLYSDEFICRVSGDRFVALLRFESQEVLIERLKNFYKIIDTLRTSMLDNNRLVLVSGIYRLTNDDEEISTAIDRANLARKMAKGQHNHGFTFYDEKIHKQVMKEKEIESIMEKALHNKEFIVYLQPKYDLKTKKIIGAEALARWKKTDGTIVSPIDFIPVFERNGFICDFDFSIFRQICVLQQKWKMEKKEIVAIAVNFSRIHINDKNFIKKMERVLREYEVEPKYLEIELTESAFVENDDSSMSLIKELQRMGFSLAMDDFGTGYSSLNLLKEASFDILKLDRSFLVNKEVSVKEKILISNIIRMAKELNIKVIAEGIETADQEEFLSDLSCDIGQGYHFSRPMPVEEFEKLVWK